MIDKRSLFFAALLTALVLTAIPASSQAGQKWQLTFQYDSRSVELVDAVLIPAMTKAVRTPGLTSAPVRVAYDFDWLDSNGKAIMSTSAQLPLGIRSTLGEGEACREIMPEEGAVVIRLDGPGNQVQAAAIRMVRTGLTGKAVGLLSLPPPFETASISRQLPSARLRTDALEGPVGVEKIRDTGSDWNRLVIVIMGDGYTAANLTAGQFETAAAGLGNDIEAKPPWDVLFAATNVYRVDIESNEQGADHETYGVLKDTYLNSSFWVSDIERLLALTGDGYSRAIAAADATVGPGVWDIILVLVNSTKYGGSGGSIAVSSVHSSASEIWKFGRRVRNPLSGIPAG